MFVPLILGNDKTTVSVATGQNEFYPVYLSIGNVRNNIRRARRNAVAVVAFLAIPKSMSPPHLRVLRHNTDYMLSFHKLPSSTKTQSPFEPSGDNSTIPLSPQY